MAEYIALSSRNTSRLLWRLSRFQGNVQNSSCLLTEPRPAFPERPLDTPNWTANNRQNYRKHISAHSARLKSKDKQTQYEVSRMYKDHIDMVRMDRELEEWIQERDLIKVLAKNISCHTLTEPFWYDMFVLCLVKLKFQAQSPMQKDGAPLTFHVVARRNRR